MPFQLTKIYRYPVKSMGGHTLTQTSLTGNGIPGDRCWTLRDEERGGFKGGKRFPVLMSMQATLKAEPSSQNPSPAAEIQLPDGSRVDTSNKQANDILSHAVGAPVSLWPLLPAEQLDHYRRRPPAPDTNREAALREVFARTPQEPLPDLSHFPAELMTYESPPGTYFDAFPLLVLSTSALAGMADAAPQHQMDIRRFRPNLLLDTDEPGFPENQWAGRRGKLGKAIIKFEMPCPRCIMTTHPCEELPKDPAIMRALVEHNQGNLGIYASIEQPGEIRVGDQLRLL